MERTKLTDDCSIELAVAWFGNMDSLDVAMMDLLSHAPSVSIIPAAKAYSSDDN